MSRSKTQGDLRGKVRLVWRYVGFILPELGWIGNKQACAMSDKLVTVHVISTRAFRSDCNLLCNDL